MGKTWYSQIRDDKTSEKGVNADLIENSIKRMQEKFEDEKLLQIYLAAIRNEEISFINFLKKQKVYKEKRWSEEEKAKIIEEVKKYGVLQCLLENIEWNEENRKVILEIVEKSYFGFSKLPENINWNEEDRKRILEIAEMNLYFEKLPENINWNEEEKKVILELAEKKDSLIVLPDNIEWNAEEKKVILELAEKNGALLEDLPNNIEWDEEERKSILKMAENSEYFLRLPDCLKLPENINWNAEEKRRILQLAEERYISLKNLPNNIEWNEEERKKILEIAEKTINLFKLPENINWNAEERKRILEIAEMNLYFEKLPENINWNEEERKRILEIADKIISLQILPNNVEWNEEERNKILGIAEKTKDSFKLPENINWNEEEKKKILEIAEKTKDSFKLPENINWNAEERKRILEIAEMNRHFEKLPENINWNEEERKKILKIVDKKNISLEILPNNIEWNNEDRKRILEIFEEFLDNLPNNIEWNEEEKKKILEITEKNIKFKKLPQNVDWSDYLTRIMKVFSLKMYEDFTKEEEKYNPIYSNSINVSLNYDIGPWIKDKIAGVTVDDAKAQKEFIKQIVERLDDIGFIKLGINLENEKTQDVSKTPLLNKENLMKQIESLDENENKPEIVALLTFYINKLTKFNEVVRYYKALDDFKYDDALEEKLNSNKDDAPKLLSYKQEKEKAEEKGSKIVETISDLRYIYNKELKDKSKDMKDFSGFLEEVWLENKDSEGKIEFTNLTNKKLIEFCKKFNEKIEELKKDGFSLEYIKENFIYSNASLQLEEDLYKKKDDLISQMIEYSMDANYKDRIALQTGKDDEGKDVIYVGLKNIFMPMSFHLKDINRFEKIDRVPFEENEEVKKYSKNNYIPYVLQNGDNETFETENEIELKLKKNAELKEKYLVDLRDKYKDAYKEKYGKKFDFKKLTRGDYFSNIVEDLGNFTQEISTCLDKVDDETKNKSELIRDFEKICELLVERIALEGSEVEEKKAWNVKWNKCKDELNYIKNYDISKKVSSKFCEINVKELLGIKSTMFSRMQAHAQIVAQTPEQLSKKMTQEQKDNLKRMISMGVTKEMIISLSPEFQQEIEDIYKIQEEQKNISQAEENQDKNAANNTPQALRKQIANNQTATALEQGKETIEEGLNHGQAKEEPDSKGE